MPSDTPVTLHHPGAGRTLRLDTDLTIIHIADLRTRLLAWLSEGPQDSSDSDDERRLDLSAVGSLDTAGVQLLLALHRSLADTGRSLALHTPAPSAAVTEVLGRYGLLDTLRAHAPKPGDSHGPG